jgi:hypothetical protein
MKIAPLIGFVGQVTLERLVDRHPVHVGIVHEPDRLVAETARRSFAS